MDWETKVCSRPTEMNSYIRYWLVSVYSTQDMYIFFGGAIITFICFFLIWKYLGWYSVSFIPSSTTISIVNGHNSIWHICVPTCLLACDLWTFVLLSLLYSFEHGTLAPLTRQSLKSVPADFVSILHDDAALLILSQTSRDFIRFQLSANGTSISIKVHNQHTRVLWV